MQIHPWNIVFLFGFSAYVIIRGVFEQRSKNNEKAVSRSDNRERLLMLIMVVGGMILPCVYLFTHWLGFADYRLPAFAPWFGTAVMVVALWLFWRSHADLGRNWSRTLEIRKGHQLVTHGVYRLVRHPMYASIWLFSLAQGLLLQNWLAGWSAFVAFAIMYFVRIPQEERMMREFFGQEYSDYMLQTGRLFPRVRAKHDA
ncbi:MAG: protein-S-isoprenylcysteine O-methyltransferase [Pyrinomonadaceae bacterium]